MFERPQESPLDSEVTEGTFRMQESAEHGDKTFESKNKLQSRVLERLMGVIFDPETTGQEVTREDDIVQNWINQYGEALSLAIDENREKVTQFADAEVDKDRNKNFMDFLKEKCEEIARGTTKN